MQRRARRAHRRSASAFDRARRSRWRRRAPRPPERRPALRRPQHGEAFHRLDLADYSSRRRARSSRSAARAHPAARAARHRPDADRVARAPERARLPSASSYTASEPITSWGTGMPRAPAIPTWSTASGRSSVSARAVAAAASTGPIPQASVTAPAAPASSRSVAATTRIIRATVAVSPERVNGCKDRRDGISIGSRKTFAAVRPQTAAITTREPPTAGAALAFHTRVTLKGDFFGPPARSGRLRHLRVKAPVASRP